MNHILLKKNILSENNNRREIIRRIVRDITTIIKNDGDGEYYLPMDVTNEDYYEFNNFPHKLVVELQITEDESMDGHLIDAEMYRENDLISIYLQYNPEDKNILLYDIIGELNEVVAHEIRHFDQYSKKMFDFSGNEPEDPVKYYTEPKELDAQVYGFKRISKLTGKPFEEVVKNWFDTHGDFHQMNDSDVEYVISKIMDYKSNL
jgi:hypothetical protein